MDTMRQIGLLGAAAMMAAAMSADVGPDGEGPPRRDRHAKRLKIEPTHHTTSKKKSASLSKLLRK